MTEETSKIVEEVVEMPDFSSSTTPSNSVVSISFMRLEPHHILTMRQ